MIEIKLFLLQNKHLIPLQSSPIRSFLLKTIKRETHAE